LVAAAVCLTACINSLPVLAADSTAPAPVRDLVPGVSKYKATILAQGQTMNLNIIAEIKDQAGMSIATESTQTPLGEGIDTVVMQKGTLLLRERHIRQGPLRIDLTFTGNRALGEMTMLKSGEVKKIDIDLGGPLFADSAGALQSFAALPLADGYMVIKLRS
jgi:hypothetical protein